MFSGYAKLTISEPSRCGLSFAAHEHAVYRLLQLIGLTKGLNICSLGPVFQGVSPVGDKKTHRGS